MKYKVVCSALLFSLLGMIISSASYAESRNFSAGPIWNQHDAESKCPATCNRHDGEWTGSWSTTEMARNSVCQCSFDDSHWTSNNAGPEWHTEKNTFGEEDSGYVCVHDDMDHHVACAKHRGENCVATVFGEVRCGQNCRLDDMKHHITCD